ncbi:hypothetical protein [Mycetocola spongiae]|uniref:hypothetical protein n=1 Tax=Mycetocola spongiae TaxID=2859226 RepID=UPI001CF533F0|nr:hypothetical protein [Mycetocola spongiae]UCR89746.1 hypothetical protein KXZ72_03455 [Mycetocola spongiae]
MSGYSIEDEYTPAERAVRERRRRRRGLIAALVAFALVAGSLFGFLAAIGFIK